MQTFHRWCATHECLLVSLALAVWGGILISGYVQQGGRHLLFLLGISMGELLILLLGLGARRWVARKWRV